MHMDFKWGSLRYLPASRLLLYILGNIYFNRENVIPFIQCSMAGRDGVYFLFFLGGGEMVGSEIKLKNSQFFMSRG